MKQKISKTILFFLFGVFSITAQTKKATKSSDELLKEAIYNKSKKEVLNYTLKDFDTLFLDFLGKQADPKIVLTKEEFYTFTIKIATFSERQAKLFPSKKQEANANTDDWKSRTYEDYLAQKAKSKK
jgi:hypothetical protein